MELKAGDTVIIENQDSLYDGLIGTVISEENWFGDVYVFIQGINRGTYVRGDRLRQISTTIR